MSILDHISLPVSDYAKSKAFYEKALAPLGIAPLMEFGPSCGFGKNGMPAFWIGKVPSSFQSPEQIAHITPIHLAFSTTSRADVDAFYKAAMAAGAKDFGAPGVRPHYHPNYYGAFVLDPDGHDIEAVYHGPV
jgi:catechol 2,3-dioxygenase-like lactoylglutathione lyase family enzyme